VTEPEMPFLEHLQELRQRLIISLIALFIGMALAWTFALSALTIIQRPLTRPSLLKSLQYNLTSYLQKNIPNWRTRFIWSPRT
jgi:sec-independent protein translocase protein TatC